MNKSIVIFMAVCLISVHAFVKRDTENANQLDTLSKQVKDFAESVNKQLGEAFNPENIKKNFNDAIDNIKKAVDNIGAKEPAKES
ncbi:uncharacterized protein LOC123689993 [Pieris rapae]|uniref:uncharacterized protein LOC123689993 n=1 Tax=Pieris rapae TaxID=64459 RepID=UPI001E27ABEA|nr:uncharacterized protein LOC123689993 [Pieris rapae]